MYSLQLGIAGTVDCIAEYNGELAIIDFKSSKKPKPRKWIDHYFVQCAAYACMLYELTNIPVKKFVILMSCENGECVVYEEYNKKKYIKLLSEYIREFVTFKLQEYGKSDAKISPLCNRKKFRKDANVSMTNEGEADLSFTSYVSESITSPSFVETLCFALIGGVGEETFARRVSPRRARRRRRRNRRLDLIA